jgi:hypothetical protein
MSSKVSMLAANAIICTSSVSVAQSGYDCSFYAENSGPTRFHIDIGEADVTGHYYVDAPGGSYRLFVQWHQGQGGQLKLDIMGPRQQTSMFDGNGTPTLARSSFTSSDGSASVRCDRR